MNKMRIHLFEALSEGQYAQVMAIATQRQVKKGEVLFWAGDPGEAMYIIVDGVLQVYTSSSDGREKILAILGPGDFVGEMSLLDFQPRSATAKALEPTALLVIDRVQFSQLLEENCGIAKTLLETLSRRLREANAQLEDFIFRDVQDRLVAVLLKLSIEYGSPVKDGIKIGIKLTHQELANYVGASRESITRSLLALQDAGYVRFSHRYVILTNITALKDMLEETDS